MVELSQTEREYLFFTDEESITKICRHVSNGGSLIDLAQMLGFRYCDVMKWIHQSKAREDAYSASLRDRSEWAKEKVLREIRQLSYFDVRKILNDEGGVLPPSQWPDEVASAVVAIDVSEEFERKGQERVQSGWLKKVKFVDKIRAIEMQAKNLKLLTEQVEHSGVLTLGELVTKSFPDDAKI